jgi:hypothetical protein
MRDLLSADRIPHLLVFLDSRCHQGDRGLPQSSGALRPRCPGGAEERRGALDFPSLVAVAKSDQSKALNYLGGSAMIIAGSGMVTAAASSINW